MSSIPHEIIHSLLIHWSYEDIITFCQTSKKHYLISLSKEFWFTKSCHDITEINYDYWGFKQIVECSYHETFSTREFYIILLFSFKGKCVRGSERYFLSDTCLSLAIINKDLPLIKYFLEQEITNLDRVATYAEEIGNKKLIKLILFKLVNTNNISDKVYCFNKLLKGCIKTGDTYLVTKIISQTKEHNLDLITPKKSYELIYDSLKFGHQQLFEYLYYKYVTNMNDTVLYENILYYTAIGGLVNNIKLALTNRATDLELAAVVAVKHDQVDILKYIIENGENLKKIYPNIRIPTKIEINLYFINAVTNEKKKVTEYLKQLVKDNVNINCN